jgi:hypothetical protein
MSGDVRRVVLGVDDEGAVSVWADGPSPHVHHLPGYPDDLALIDLWYSGPLAAPPGADTADRDLAVAPDPGGSLFRVVQFPPDDALPIGDDGHPAIFWHETDTTDFNVLLSGRLALCYDRGEVHLGPGDTVVVQGGRHAWSNPSDELAVLATVAVARPSAKG